MMKTSPRVGRKNHKPIDELTIENLKQHPVWRFSLEEESQDDWDETWVRPVKKQPVKDLTECFVGTEARLACGKRIFCLFGGIDLQDSQYTEEFIQVRVFKSNEESFFLARPGHVDYDNQNPKALAKLLGLRMKDVFPITYDISEVAVGLEGTTSGRITLKMFS